jgi:hypothetical protein
LQNLLGFISLINHYGFVAEIQRHAVYLIG